MAHLRGADSCLFRMALLWHPGNQILSSRFLVRCGSWKRKTSGLVKMTVRGGGTPDSRSSSASLRKTPRPCHESRVAAPLIRALGALAALFQHCSLARCRKCTYNRGMTAFVLPLPSCFLLGLRAPWEGRFACGSLRVLPCSRMEVSVVSGWWRHHLFVSDFEKIRRE